MLLFTYKTFMFCVECYDDVYLSGNWEKHLVQFGLLRRRQNFLRCVFLWL